MPALFLRTPREEGGSQKPKPVWGPVSLSGGAGRRWHRRAVRRIIWEDQIRRKGCLRRLLRPAIGGFERDAAN